MRGAGALLLLACLGLGGCSGLFRSNAKAEQIYYIRSPSAAAGASSAGPAVASPASAAAATPSSLRVGRPVADPGLDGTHIMLVQADHRMNFFSGSRWPAPTPELIESLAVQVLRASGQWASVEDSASPFPSDYLLQIQVRRFEADYTGGGDSPSAQVVLDCTVGRVAGRTVLATFTVAGSAQASSNHMSQVVAAFEQATGTALTAAAQQSAQVVRLEAQRLHSEEKPANR